MELEVGKQYRHYLNHDTIFTITERYGSDIFEGHNSAQTYLFKKNGEAIAAKGSAGTSCFSIINLKQTKEVFHIYSDSSIGDWEEIKKDSPWTTNTMYCVRTDRDNSTCQIMTHEEFCDLVDEYLS